MNLPTARDTIDMVYGPPLQVISDCLRGFLIAAEGHDFIGCDFSAIEARVLAWLAGQEDVLAIFRSNGDIYKVAAAKIYRIHASQVTKEQRQIGKVAVLALGYQGGKKAFNMMAKAYGVKVSEDQAEEIKKAWREANVHIVRYWANVEDAARMACLTPGVGVQAGPKSHPVTYKKLGQHLFCRLPSGRVLTYPYPMIQSFETPWKQMKEGLTYMAENSLTHRWERTKTYGGSLVENITQAVARDLLAEAMIRLEAAGYPVVMHVHDEVLCEVPLGFGSPTEMAYIMSKQPAWATGLPITAEGWRGRRYQK